MATTKKAIAEAEQAAEIKETIAAPTTEPGTPAVTLDELESMDMNMFVDKTTGELVEGVQIIEKPDTFTVDV